MTGAQKWLLNEMSKMKYPGWAAIEFTVKTKVPMNEDALKKSAYYLLDKYENLRVKIFNRDGQWIQELYPLAEAEPFACYDFSKEEPHKRVGKMKQICMRIRELLLPANGNLIRILFFKFSENEGRIWFYMHHVISDFVSALLVSSEFMHAYNSVVHNRELKRQAVKEYRKWQYVVEGYSRDVLLPSEFDYWISLPWDKIKVLPSDFPEKFGSDEAIIEAINSKRLINSYKSNSHLMEEEETFRLVNKYGGEFESILMAVFFTALAHQMKIDWLDITASYSGRSILPFDYAVNESRLVGYLADVRVLLLQNPGTENIYSDVHRVIDQIGTIPNNGIGYRLIFEHIRNEQLKKSFVNLRKNPQVLFNYLGRANTTINNEHYELIKENIGQDDYPQEIKNSIFECVAGINHGQLYISLSYIDEYHKETTAIAILRSMVDLLRQLLSESKNETGSFNKVFF